MMNIKKFTVLILLIFYGSLCLAQLQQREVDSQKSKRIAQSSLKNINRLPVKDMIEGGLHIVAQGAIGLSQQVESADFNHSSNLYSLAVLRNGEIAFSYQAYSGKGWSGQTQFLNVNLQAIGNPVEFARPSSLNRLHQLQTTGFGEHLLVVSTENKKGKRLPSYRVIEHDRISQSKPHYFSEANCDLIRLTTLPGNQSALIAYEDNWIGMKEKEGRGHLMTLKASKINQPQQTPLSGSLVKSLHLTRNEDGSFLAAYSGQKTTLKWMDSLGETIAENREVTSGDLGFLETLAVGKHNFIVFYQLANQPDDATYLSVFNKQLELQRETPISIRQVQMMKLSNIGENLILAVYAIPNELKASLFNAKGEEMHAITLTGRFTGNLSAFAVIELENGKVMVVFADEEEGTNNVRWVQISYKS